MHLFTLTKFVCRNIGNQWYLITRDCETDLVNSFFLHSTLSSLAEFIFVQIHALFSCRFETSKRESKKFVSSFLALFHFYERSAPENLFQSSNFITRLAIF